jgi:ubiquitin-conjugating enzyme E2 J2
MLGTYSRSLSELLSLRFVHLLVALLAYLGHQYSEDQMKDLPNMGEKERGVSDATPKPVATAVPPEARRPARREVVTAHQQGKADGVHTWASTLRRVILEKWRWGAFLVIAIVVSRYST